MNEAHLKAQATRKANQEAIKADLERKRQIAWELQGPLKEIIRDERATVSQKLEAAKIMLSLEKIVF